MLHLPDVTLVCATSCYDDLTAMAVRECVRRVKFADVLVWAPEDLKIPGARAYISPNFRSVADYDRFMWFLVWQHVKTSHYLNVQWDSWVTNPEMWTDDFLLCDYIGAPWPWHHNGANVGNSGFSLWSVKLAQFLTQNEREFPFASPMDVHICQRLRPRLERHGFAWADAALASRFSFETVADLPPQTFGFHAFRNWPFVLNDTALDERLSYCDAHAFKDGQLEWFNQNRAKCRSTLLNAA